MRKTLDKAQLDEIDDRVAEALELYYAEREPERPRVGSLPILVSLALGAVATVASVASAGVLCAMWASIAVVNLAYFLLLRRHSRRR
ncbi:MAG: hypothetical protein JWQ81_609 [Amycolatopsis sp.]|jgi:uncharacterized membrane protein YoaK (UPF0700 family)|uniref:hypothetical protein n=1 Tax=Amycolatopsis sp. TaxID=37632 RepID=UPI0026086F0E|nr:hypothetical protein [Amycolatopsis sp.]MCU1679870.1 hypothetical protein [Amycolatopsis sp.]